MEKKKMLDFTRKIRYGQFSYFQWIGCDDVPAHSKDLMTSHEVYTIWRILYGVHSFPDN